MTTTSTYWKFYAKVTERFDDKPLLKCLLKAVPVIVGVSIGAGYAQQAGWLASLDNMQIDAFVSGVPLKQRHTLIVHINDDDYKKNFGSRSPLKPDAVMSIIQKIQSGNPVAIVVDLDTSDISFAKCKISQGKAPIIWARTAVVEKQSLGEPSRSQRNSSIFQLEPLLGKRGSDGANEFGIAMLPQSEDGRSRFYCRSLLVRDGHDLKAQNSLPWQVIEVLGKGGEIDAKAGEKVFFPLAKDADHLDKTSINQLDSIVGTEGWKDLVRNKVVVLGGTFRAARDRYVTAAGEMAGAEIIAQIIDGELQRKVLGKLNPVMLGVISSLAGLGLAFLNCRFQSGYVLFAGFFLIPVIAFLVSYITAQIASVWLSFLPVLYAVQLHCFWDYVKEFERMKKKLDDLEKVPQNTGAEI